MDRWVYSTGIQPPLGEHTLASFSGCRLYDGENKTDFKDGQITVTSHRIKFNKDSTSLYIPLRLIIMTKFTPSSWRDKGKVEMQLQSWEKNQKPAGPIAKASSQIAKISMTQKGSEEFCVETIMKALKNRVWEQQKSSPTQATMGILAPVSSKSRGIGGAVRGQEQKHEQESNLQSLGLQDLNNLMAHAKEMATLARATSSRLEKKAHDNSKMDDVAKLRGIMMNLGLDENLDGHGGLESEIARVARPLLELQGGMVLLEEVYCAVNRARGTSLVSPDEVYSAAKHIAEKCPQAGLKYKKYKSGITVLQDNSISDNAIIDEILIIITTFPDGLSPEMYSSTRKCSPILAREQLILAEDCGELCRDDSPRGLLYFPNRLLIS